MDVAIYHNPRCNTSRTVLADLRGRGIEPRIVEYLKTPPDRPTLERIMAATGLEPRGLMRRKEPVYKQLGLDAPATTRDQLIDAMLANPILIERPIVISAKGTVLCRPADKVGQVL